MLKGKKFCGISERLLSKMSTMSATAGTLARFGHDPALDFAPSAARKQLSVEPGAVIGSPSNQGADHTMRLSES
jgi:hypothetical protein